MAISEQEALELIGEFEKALLIVEEIESQGGAEKVPTHKAQQQLELSAAALYRALTGKTPSPDILLSLLGG